MATQTISYMNVLSDHAAAIRALPKSDGAYQRIIDQGRVLSPKTRWPVGEFHGLAPPTTLTTY